MNGTTFSRNNANFGGGIGNHGTITVSDSTFAINYAYSGSGGIANGGTLTVSNSVFADNRAHTFGGGIGNFGTAILINSTFSGIGPTALVAASATSAQRS